MAKVSLSRVNSMIKTLKDENGVLNMRLLKARTSLSTRVFEGTTDDDMERFRAECRKQRDEVFRLLDERCVNVGKIAALRKVLDEGNRRHGVLDRLLEISAMQSEMDNALNALNFIESHSRDGGLRSFTEMKDAAFYKTAFTEKERSWCVDVSIFEPADMEKLRERIDGMRRKIQEARDELARINQTRFIVVNDELLEK